MGTQQINEEELKKMVIEAIKATFQPKFDRIQRRIDELKLRTNNIVSPQLSAVHNPNSVMNCDNCVPTRTNKALDVKDRSLELIWVAERGHSSGSKVEKEAGASRLCSSPIKQSVYYVDGVVALARDSTQEITSEVYPEVEGMTKSQQEVPEQTVGDRIPPLTGTQKLCQFLAEQSSEIDDIVVLYGDDSKQEVFINTFNEDPGMFKVDKIHPERARMKNHEVGCLPLTVPQFDSKTGYLVGELERDSIQSNDAGKFLDDHRTRTDAQFISKISQFRIPNLESDELGSAQFENANSWKIAVDDSSLPRGIRSAKMDGKFDSVMEKAPASRELRNGSLDCPNSYSGQGSLFAAKLRHSGKLPDHLAELVLVNKGQIFLSDDEETVWVEESAIEWGMMCREAAIAMPKIVFEQPTFDHQFCEAFDKKNDQALRAKLFEEGEPT
ncbi:unnamed protein product [Linum trigynum]|uniref:Uncharacterized protein n=1 Tax=Linum trigynum TaxID=586398 RepID=A0AAV2ERW3_9ROSI